MTQQEKIELIAMYDGWEKSEFKFKLTGYTFSKSGYCYVREIDLESDMKYITSLDWLHPVAMKVQGEIRVFEMDILAKGSYGSLELCIRKQSSIASSCSRPSQNGQYLNLFESVVEGILFINEQKQKENA